MSLWVKKEQSSELLVGNSVASLLQWKYWKKTIFLLKTFSKIQFWKTSLNIYKKPPGKFYLAGRMVSFTSFNHIGTVYWPYLGRCGVYFKPDITYEFTSLKKKEQMKVTLHDTGMYSYNRNIQINIWLYLGHLCKKNVSIPIWAFLHFDD